MNEINELIFAGVKLVCDENSVLLKKMSRNLKTKWKIRQETLLFLFLSQHIPVFLFLAML